MSPSLADFLPFGGGANSGSYTPETIARRAKIAEELLKQSSGAEPIRHWTQGANKIAEALVGSEMLTRTEKMEAERRYQDKVDAAEMFGVPAPARPAMAETPFDKIRGLLGGGSSNPAAAAFTPAIVPAGASVAPRAALAPEGGENAPMASAPPMAQQGPDYGRAIASVESAGEQDPYRAIGPVTKKGDRAYGKHQVMDFNIGPWTKEVLGQEMTPQQYLDNPQAQDAVFKAKFGQYMKQTGNNPQDAASMWFTGKPLAQGADRSDRVPGGYKGMTGQQYVDKFTTDLNSQVWPLPPRGGDTAPATALAPPPAPPAMPPGMPTGTGAGAMAPPPGTPAPPPTNMGAMAPVPGSPANPTRQQLDIPMDVRKRAMIGYTSDDPKVRAQALADFAQYRKPPTEKVEPLTADERKKYGLRDDVQGATIDRLSGKIHFPPPQMSVNLNTAQKGQELMAGAAVDDFKAAQTAGREAQKRIPIWDAMSQASQGFKPGATAEIKLQAKRLLKDIGVIEGADVPDAEVFQTLQKQLQIHSQPKGQGAVSNFERELFSQAVANMKMSPEALERSIAISKKLDEFDQKVANVYRANARRNKGVPDAVEANEEIDKLGAPLSPADISYLNRAKGNKPATEGAGGAPTQPAAGAASDPAWIAEVKKRGLTVPAGANGL